jgi:DNA-binding transcriptional ArsR family regulator
MRSTEDRLDHLFGALSDRTRRKMVARLAKAPATIGELAEPFTMSLPAVSKHVRVLERAGLVRRKVDGRIHRCALDRRHLRAANEWLARYTEFWDQTLESLAAFAEDKSR